ncbi:uncharacterized protein LOC106096216 [Stomoxys calcitrans]|uniref:uncharacterized protein LOC106096216 n=1 Tax=Stomoxys calcitrans TaxID=35570 RepID=UPI0027E32EBF|nr:uncharacterized protein LOC106096216 [Stomoxys calcitrans]
MAIHIIGGVLCLCSLTMAAIYPANVALLEDSDFYPSIPNDIIPIQPLLVYPKSRNALPYQGRNLLKDNDIVYVKLLDRKGYRPRNLQSRENGFRELSMKDIFYVKAATNGQFSTNRLKVYRLPEFYAINVYKKGDLLESSRA